ncbi:hypothetical protein FRC02_006449 [Tulasnella sp. 418]|nr:hypothetical protein FRC02_006449 [Tulasnella sp. 418]
MTHGWLTSPDIAFDFVIDERNSDVGSAVQESHRNLISCQQAGRSFLWCSAARCGFTPRRTSINRFEPMGLINLRLQDDNAPTETSSRGLCTLCGTHRRIHLVVRLDEKSPN